MNLLKALQPFEENLKHFKSGYGITDTIAIQKLADIWDEFAGQPHRKKAIYGSETANIPKTKTTCASCIKDMMNMLCNWQKIVEGERVEAVEFKAVKQAKVEVVKPSNLVSFKPDWRNLRMNVGDPMTYGEAIEKFKGEKLEAIVKDALNAINVKFHHKMKLPNLLKLLNESK